MNITAGEHGLKTLLQRAIALDSQALARVQQLSDDQLDIFVTTPFNVLASRRITGTLNGAPGTFSATAFLEGTQLGDLTAAWPGALPPHDGWQELDVLPVDVVHQLADQGRDLARQFSGPMGPPKSLLDQTVIEVSNESAVAAVSMRLIFACTSLGLIPGIGARPDIPRHLRVSKCGRWTRIDAPFGSVYQNQGLGLLV